VTKKHQDVNCKKRKSEHALMCLADKMPLETKFDVFWSKMPKYLVIGGWITIFSFSFINSFVVINRNLFYVPIAMFITSNVLRKKYFEAFTSLMLSSVLFYVWFEYGKWAVFWTSLISIPIMIVIYVLRNLYVKRKKRKENGG